MAAPTNSTPFFGCKISLISKSEIRYEGILYTIDPKESTIALAKVKSFGSEDRPVDRPVPPRDEIFEFIIFRASDIKDLIVDEPQPTSLGDPAIIQAHSTSTSFPSSFPQASISSAQSGSLQQQLQRAGVQPSRSSGQDPPVASVPDSTKVKASTSTASSSAPQAPKSTAATSSNNANRQPARNPFTTNQQQLKPQQPQNNRTLTDGGNNGGLNNMRSNSNFVRKTPNNNRPRTENETSNYNQRNGHQNFRSNFNNRFQYRMPMMGGYNRRPNTNRNFVNTKPAQKTLTPIPDFDFEKAQTEFQILEEQMSNLKMNGSAEENADAEEAETTNNAAVEEESDKEPTYNKAKSFFDTVSCEAIEREKGNVQRVDWKAERKLNRETFGVVGNRRPNFRTNRGGYGGGQGYNRGYNSYRSRNSQQQNRSPSNTTGGGSRPPKTNGTPGAGAGPSTSTGSPAAASATPSTSTQPIATAVNN